MLFDLLKQARALNASDVHLAVGLAPRVRVQGALRELAAPPVTQQLLEQELRGLLPESAWQTLARTGEVDAAFSDNDGERYRLNAYLQGGQYALAVRLLASSIPTCAKLGLPPSVQRLAELEQGLVLSVGPTGSGKSTTLAALLQRINMSRAVHIVTLEDPVEYVYPQGQALISQREIGRDTAGFASGLRSALRQDPDVILVGELRDSESIAKALSAAETGHLVFATLHTQDAAGSINRILDALPERQAQVRTQLAECLQAIVCQRLLPRVDGRGRVAAFEVLVATEALRNLIREGRTHQLESYIQTGKRFGMVTLAEAVSELRRQGIIK